MEEYISKSALISEIERIKKEECPTDTYEGRIKLFYFERFLSFIDTLEVKEVDLEKEIYKWWLGKTRQTYGMVLNPCNIRDFAKHFFELGMQVSSKAQKGEKI